MEQKSIPMVTIVMGTFKRSHIIGRTLKSILVQSFRDFEIVIIDDNYVTEKEEITNTRKVIEEFNDPRIRYIKNHTNLGHPANFRKCFDEIRGVYFILYSDDDEMVNEGILETMVSYLEQNQTASLVHGYDIFKYPDGTSYEVPFAINETKLLESRIYLQSQLLYEDKYNWSQSAVLYRTDFMRYHQIPVVHNYMWDSVFHASYLLHSKDIGHINQYFCIRNEELRHTGRNSEAFNFHAFIEVDYMMLKFIKDNEALLISKNYKVNKLKKAVAWKMTRQFVHVTNFNHAIFCLKLALKELLSLYFTYMAWLPIKIIAIVYGKFTALKYKLLPEKGK